MTAPTFEPAHPISASKALALAALGMGALSAMDAVAKGLGADFPVTQVVAMRYFSAALWLALFIAVTRRAWPQRRFIGRHLVRAALMSLTAFLFFYAITHLPLAVATALVMSSPVYVALLGIVFLKEPARASIGLAIIVGLVGAAVIIGWGGDTVSATGETSPLAWAAALLAPLSYAVGIVLLKHHSADENAAAITLAQSVLATLIVLPFALPTFAMPEGGQWFSVGLVGLLGAGGYLLAPLADIFVCAGRLYVSALGSGVGIPVFCRGAGDQSLDRGRLDRPCVLYGHAGRPAGHPAKRPPGIGDRTPVVVGKLIGSPRKLRTARKAKHSASIASPRQPTLSAGSAATLA
jgi:drug/metabolite transporter (DMT)-like permease